ncbi:MULTISPECIES: substrate-binding periplasmic protein [Chromobacterium]|nr:MULTISPECIES: transporter substrate-binding domain-containing protein [Chromobacterium]WSE93154.1 transporter substrate-binding domain-containing protein [Chromobacterium subtsugae]WVH61532.1 transporter substrate-binding domain-containing protein [Chromobacterium subtsugae]
MARQIAMVLAAACCWCAAAVAAADIHAYTEDVPPLNYLENNNVQGYSTEVLRLVAKEAGLKLSIDVLPWLRAYAKVESTPDTLLYTIVRTPEREQHFQWVGPIGPRRIYLYRLAARDDIRIASPNDLLRYHNGALAGSAAASQLAALGLQAGSALDIGHSDATNLKKLQLGRLDLVAMLDWAMAWQLRLQGKTEKAVAPVLLLDGKLEYWFALNRATPPERVKQLQDALNRIRADGRLQAIRRRYRSD